MNSDGKPTTSWYADTVLGRATIDPMDKPKGKFLVSFKALVQRYDSMEDARYAVKEHIERLISKGEI